MNKIHFLINRLRIWWIFRQCDPDFMLWAFGFHHKDRDLYEKFNFWNSRHSDIFTFVHLPFYYPRDIKYRLSLMGSLWEEHLKEAQEFAAKVE